MSAKKSIESEDYQLLITMLRQEREARDIPQAAVGEAFGISASQLAKWERLERRVDVSEVRLYCKTIGISFVEFISNWDKQVTREKLDAGRIRRRK